MYIPLKERIQFKREIYSLTGITVESVTFISLKDGLHDVDCLKLKDHYSYLRIHYLSEFIATVFDRPLIAGDRMAQSSLERESS